MVLALALLPAVGNVAGGVIAEFLDVSPRRLNLALHMAAGIVIAVVAVEIIPEALRSIPAWLLVLAFLGGGGVYILFDALLEHGSEEGGDEARGAWMIYIAVAADLFSDGLLIGAGTAISFGLALVLALGQVTADIPEGFAAVASFKATGLSRGKRLLLSASFAAPVLVGASLSYFLLRGQNDAVKYAALVFTAGLILLAAVEEMIREAHEAAPDSRLSAASFVIGFALFTTVSTYLG